LQNSEFQSHFSASKINEIFLGFCVKNIRLEKQLLEIKLFENFDFYSTLFSKNMQKCLFPTDAQVV
jgi:hypothetical protein